MIPVYLIIGSLAVTLGMLETFLRIAGYDLIKRTFTREAVNQRIVIRKSIISGLEYDLRPNTHGYSNGTAVVINSFGFRDREYEVPKRDKYRVIVLGDSLIFGIGMESDHTLPRRLEAYLRRRNIEVMNFGVPGYNIADEAKFLQNTGLQFSPDLVILGICVNDAGIFSGELPLAAVLGQMDRFPIRYSRVLQTLAVNVSRFKLRITGTNRKPAFEEVLRIKYGIRSSEVSPDAVLDGLMEQLRKVQLDGLKEGSMTTWYESRIHTGVLKKGLLEIKRLSEASHFKVLAVLFPYLAADNADRWQIVYHIIEHEVSIAGFDFISLEPDFKRAGFENVQRVQVASDGKHHRDPLHFNRLGSELAAKRISDHMISNILNPQ
jgi:hypothetical protein